MSIKTKTILAFTCLISAIVSACFGAGVIYGVAGTCYALGTCLAITAIGFFVSLGE